MFVTAAHAQSNDAPATGGEATQTETGAQPTHSETGAGQGGTEAHFPPFNPDLFASQILWLAIVFGLFYLFVQKAVVPRIGGILENRRDRIAQDLDEASRLKEEADEAIAAYEQALAEARSKANDIAREAHENARAEADREREKVEADLAEKTEAAEKEIAEIKASALGEVDTIAQETASEIVTRLIGGSVTKAEASTAVKSANGR